VAVARLLKGPKFVEQTVGLHCRWNILRYAVWGTTCRVPEHGRIMHGASDLVTAALYCIVEVVWPMNHERISPNLMRRAVLFILEHPAALATPPPTCNASPGGETRATRLCRYAYADDDLARMHKRRVCTNMCDGGVRGASHVRTSRKRRRL
jgi:hypothetical protein